MSARATMWIGSARGRVLEVIAALMAVAAVVAAVIDSLVAAAVCLVAAGFVAAFSRVTVMVDRRGVTVLYSRLRWPRTVVPLAEVVAVEAVTTSPSTWGGWGYRGSRKAFGKAAVLIRGGPGLELTIADGSTLSVSVDHPDGAVSSLRELLAEQT